MRVVIVVVDGRVHLPLPAAGSPVRGRGFDRGAAGEGQDLEGPLGDGGQMGVALFVRTDVVDVVPKQAAVALRRDARLPVRNRNKVLNIRSA